MADQFTGKNLAVSVGSAAVTCPQSFEINGQHDFVEFYCVGTDGKQRIYDGTNWTASCVWFPEDNDHADLTDFNNTTAGAVTVYPDGNTSGKMKITFTAYASVGLNISRGSVGSSTINFTIDGDVTFTNATGS